jgi:hypothetical protein
VAPLSVSIGTVTTATPPYAGTAPEEIYGLLQVNVTVPSGVSPGSAVPVILTIGLQFQPEGTDDGGDGAVIRRDFSAICRFRENSPLRWPATMKPMERAIHVARASKNRTIFRPCVASISKPRKARYSICSVRMVPEKQPRSKFWKACGRAAPARFACSAKLTFKHGVLEVIAVPAHDLEHFAKTFIVADVVADDI